MQTQLNNILQAAKEQLANAATLAEVNDVRVKYMGKKGEVTQILKGMGKLPPEEKKELGQAANKVRNEIEELVNERMAEVKAASRIVAMSFCEPRSCMTSLSS